MPSRTGEAAALALLLAAVPARAAAGAGWHGWERDLRLELQLDRRTAWVGEQVTASIYLVSPVPGVRLETFSAPALDGFWAEVLELPARLEPRPRASRGVPVYASLVKRIALFPTRAGSLPIGPFEADVALDFVTGSRDFASYRARERAHRASPTVALEVRPLPSGAPPGFDPADVGTLDLSIAAAEPRATAGEPLAVRITVRGEGNVRAWSLPALPPLAGTHRFDPTATERLAPARGRFAGSRTVETLLVPEGPGDLEVPALAWPWFDPKAGRYQVARTRALRIPVSPGVAPAPMPPAPAAPAAPRPIHARDDLRRTAPPPWRAPVFALLAALPPLAYAGLRLDGLRRRRAEATAPARRRTQAAKVARRRLDAAARTLASGDAAGALAEVQRALHGHASDRLGRQVAGLTRAALAEALGAAGAPAEGVRALVAALDDCDAARFGGGAPVEPLLAAARAALARLGEAPWGAPLEERR